MGRVYPRAPESKAEPVPVDEASCVAAIIQAKESDTPKAEAVGSCLSGSGDVAGFERLWDEVDAQAKAARAVRPADYDTVTKYKAAVSAAAPLLDATLWYNGLKDETGAGSFAELKAKTE